MPHVSMLLVETVKDVAVVTINTSSVVDATLVESIRADLMQLVEKQAKRRMVIDLTKVQHLSSAALGMLMPLQKAVEKQRGMLVLCGMNKQLRKVFKLTGLTKLFKIQPDERKALLDFGVSY